MTALDTGEDLAKWYASGQVDDHPALPPIAETLTAQPTPACELFHQPTNAFPPVEWILLLPIDFTGTQWTKAQAVCRHNGYSVPTG